MHVFVRHIHAQYIHILTDAERRRAKGVARLSSAPLTEIVFCGWQIKCKYFCYACGAFVVATPTVSACPLCRRGGRQGGRKGRLNYACQWSALSPRVAACNGRQIWQCACVRGSVCEGVCVRVCVYPVERTMACSVHSVRGTLAIIMGAMMARRQLFCHIKLC